MTEPTFIEIVTKTLSGAERVYEPVPSNRLRSPREMRLGREHIRHRFTFKGAISMSQIIAQNVMQHNALLHTIRARSATSAKEKP